MGEKYVNINMKMLYFIIQASYVIEVNNADSQIG